MMPTQSLCSLSAIPTTGARGFELRGHTYIVLRQGGQIRVYLNRCPHLGLPLEWQPHQFFDSQGRFLQCATHGALFRPEDGYCLYGPCAGKYLPAVKFFIEGQRLHVQTPD